MHYGGGGSQAYTAALLKKATGMLNPANGEN